MGVKPEVGSHWTTGGLVLMTEQEAETKGIINANWLKEKIAELE